MSRQRRSDRRRNRRKPPAGSVAAYKAAHKPTPHDVLDRREAAARREAARKAKGPIIVGVEMGEAIAIEYRRDGKGYRHEFKRRPKLARSRDGKHLFVSPVKAGTWIEDYKP